MGGGGGPPPGRHFYRGGKQTSQPKFKIVSISKAKTNEVIINDNSYEFSNQTNVLGLTFTRTGIVSHLKNRMKQARAQMTKLKRFQGMSTKTLIHLYTSLIRPIIEYPFIPTCLASNNNLIKMQTI